MPQFWETSPVTPAQFTLGMVGLVFALLFTAAAPRDMHVTGFFDGGP